VAAAALAVTIETPPPGTVVGSPLVLTGRTSRMPTDGALRYRVRDDVGAELGAGMIAVWRIESGGTFSGELLFAVPPTGGEIAVELYQADGASQGHALINLVVAPSLAPQITPAPVISPDPVAQAIMIDTPPPDTLVGSPLVITGRTARQPYQSVLSYSMFAGSVSLASGFIPVSGSPGSFNLSLFFDLPSAGGPVSIELIDQDPATGAVVARTSLALQVVPPPGPTAPTGERPTIITITPTVTATSSPTMTPTLTPCVGFTCDSGEGPPLALPSGDPNEPSYTPCQVPNGEPWIDTYQPVNTSLGQQRTFYACEFTDPLTAASMTLSDGTVQTLTLLNPPAGSAAVAMVRWAALPSTPTESTILTLTEADGGAQTLQFMVLAPAAATQHILVVPQAAAPGAEFTAYLVNFPIGTAITVSLYSQATADSVELVHRRDFSVVIDQPLAGSAGGWGRLMLRSSPDDPQLIYGLGVNNGALITLFWLR